MLPRSGLQAIFVGSGRPFVFERRPLPALRRGEALVRNDYTTLCRSDLATWAGKRCEAVPTVLGHEVVGHVVDVDSAAPPVDVVGRPLRVGDRVTWAIFASDPASARARAGMPQKAAGLFKYGHETITDDCAHHGGLGEFTLLREHTPIARLDEGIPDPGAALVNCSIATVAGALRLAGEIRDQRVLVSGAGMLGLCACAMATDRGARDVVAVDVDAARAARSLAFGAGRCEVVGSDGSGFAGLGPCDVVLEFSGAPIAMAASLSRLEIGGRAVWVGAVSPQPPTLVDAELVVRRLLTIRGLHNYNREDFVAAVDFVAARHARWPFLQLVHDAFRLADVDAAFRHAVEHNPVRVGVRIQDAADQLGMVSGTDGKISP